MFFVISGFIIPYSLHRSQYKVAHFPRFLLRRLVRLEPPYLTSIALIVFIWELAARAPGFGGAPPSYSLGQIFAHFLYVIPLTHYSWLNIVYWTLAYEFVFYILAGLLWPVLAHRPLLYTAFLVAFIQAVKLPCSDKPMGAALLFFMGICCARKVLKLDALWVSFTASVIAIVALSWIVDPIVAFHRFPDRLLHCVRRCSAHSHPELPGSDLVFAVSPPRSVGGRVINIGRRFIDGPIHEFFLSLAALAVSLVVATIFCKYVEDPAKRASKRIALSPPYSRLASQSTSG